jgi:carbamoylphosphate synthase large subunit
VTSPASTCELSRSKQATYEFFKDIIQTPKVYDIDRLQESDLPVFLKPDVGQGSKGTHLAKTIEEAEFYTKKDPGLLVLEYLPGKEYTVECFTDKAGNLLFCEGRVRTRVMNGISVSTVQVKNERFKSIAEQINRHLKLRGVWFFQIKHNKTGELALMEIAARVAGTMALIRARGVNLPLLSLFDRLGYDIDIFENQNSIIIDRALDNKYQHDISYKHVYLDFDDLVIFEGKVNPEVMAFVYQCMNKRIKTYLLTRHRQDLDKSLRKYRLDGIFDELIWLKNGEPKASYIKHKDAIFIDDSFAERKAVHDTLGIPVFDAHAVEALMEKF